MAESSVVVLRDGAGRARSCYEVRDVVIISSSEKKKKPKLEYSTLPRPARSPVQLVLFSICGYITIKAQLHNITDSLSVQITVKKYKS